MISRQAARERWVGVLDPVVTPFRPDGAVDLETLRGNVQWLLDRGARTGNTILLAAGSGGDFPMMNLDERKRVIAAIAEAADGRLPIIAGVQSLDVRDTIDLCRHAEALGLDAVQISGPFYYDGHPEDVVAWFDAVAASTNVGLALYNNWYTGYDMPLDLMERLADTPRVVGAKWASPNIDTFTEGVHRLGARVPVINNTLNTVYGHLVGCRAFVSHWPNFYPEFPWRIGELMDAGQHADAQRLFDDVMRPYRALVARVARHTAGEAVWVRPLMEAAGLDGGVSRLPSRDGAVTPEIRAQFREVLERARSLVGVPAGSAT